MSAVPTLIPFGRTARRLEWRFLPPRLRSAIERRCGAPVVEAVSDLGGFAPGFAATLVCADGSRHYVKGGSVQAQRAFALGCREEARVLRGLPAGLPAPRLAWVLDDDWVVLGFADSGGRTPQRPWRPGDLDPVLDALEIAAELLTPVPATVRLPAFADAFADFATAWDDVRRLEPELAHVDEAESLALRYADVTGGDTVAHTDLRDDNVLLTASGALVQDWGLAVSGAPWLDTVLMLIGPRGDGLDADRLLRERRLTRDVPAEHVDILLALVVGHLLRQCHQPAPPASPYLRDLQSWQAAVVWDWLAERRGWGTEETG